MIKPMNQGDMILQEPKLKQKKMVQRFVYVVIVKYYVYQRFYNDGVFKVAVLCFSWSLKLGLILVRPSLGLQYVTSHIKLKTQSINILYNGFAKHKQVFFFCTGIISC